MVDAGESLITHSRLVADLRALGVDLGAGQALMLHASVKAVGKVMGGPNSIIQAVLETLGPDGTLMMYVGWEDLPDFIPDLPAALQQAYYDEHPAFDPAIARAVRDFGIVAECLRTWPGAQRSQNPEASMVAVGLQTRSLTDAHPRNYGYGPGSPLAKLIELHGQVLMLGAPLDTITLLHYAENVARLRQKAMVRYSCPIQEGGQRVWIDMEEPAASRWASAQAVKRACRGLSQQSRCSTTFVLRDGNTHA
jgi:aminoglycoside 3-N-acetyltransferase